MAEKAPAPPELPLQELTLAADGRNHCVQVLIPEWPAPLHVRALFTTRQGGYSAAPWDGWNLGDHVHDHPAHVRANRALLGAALAQWDRRWGHHGQAAQPGDGPDSPRPVFLQQTHGCDTVRLGVDQPADAACADAALATGPGLACTIMVADCLPVLLAHAQAPVVAAAHAGWRGLAGVDGRGILEHSFARYAQAVAQWYSAQGHSTPSTTAIAAQTLAWLGPCIGPQAFEVGDEVRLAFTQASQASQAQAPLQQALESYFRPSDADGPTAGNARRWLADLPGLARWRLQRLGLQRIDGNPGTPSWCTHSNPALFFSHRRDSAHLGNTGRMAACIWVTAHA